MQRLLSVTLLSAILLSGVSCASRHDVVAGWTVIEVETDDVTKAHQIELLAESLGVDVWQHASLDRVAHLAVSPDVLPLLTISLKELDADYKTLVPELSRWLEERDEELSRYRATRTSTQPFQDYPRHQEINDYLEDLSLRHPDLVTLVDAGLSYEGREIKYVRVSTTNFTDTSKPVIFMDSLMHAREWVTGPVTLYWLHRLLDERREQDQDLLEDIDWVVWPVVNPDGYEFTHTDTRLWRRTRSINLNVSTTCIGVDANRNFDVSFNTIGVSSNPCSDTYPGAEPFSEPETRLIRNALLELGERIQIYLNIHSYGNWVLYGYGNASLPQGATHLHAVGAVFGAATDAVKLPIAPFYRVGNSAMLLYGSSGSAQDYGQSIGIPASYTIELPGLGYLFSVPPEYIEQINLETWQGIAATARMSVRLYADRISRN